MRRSAILLLCLTIIFLASCGKKEVKPVSQESRTALEAFGLAEKIKTAFTERDLATLKSSSTEKGYADIMTNSKPFDTVSLNFTPRWVEIEDNKILLNIAWKSTWNVSGSSVEDEGMAVFVFEGRPLKLAGILRANPFVLPEK